MLFKVTKDRIDQFASEFWRLVKERNVFAFHGEMGAGKTTVITTLCRQKGVKDPMSSPTFSVINEYTYAEDGKRKSIFHIDLYRLNNVDEVVQAGVEDCMDKGAICLIEWPEKAPGLFDRSTVHVYIKPVSDNERQIEIRMPE